MYTCTCIEVCAQNTLCVCAFLIPVSVSMSLLFLTPQDLLSISSQSLHCIIQNAIKYNAVYPGHEHMPQIAAPGNTLLEYFEVWVDNFIICGFTVQNLSPWHEGLDNTSQTIKNPDDGGGSSRVQVTSSNYLHT